MGRFIGYHHLMPLIVTMSRNVVKKCAQEATKMTNGGDLEYELPSGYSVGQELCIGLNNAHGIDSCRNEPVYVYSNNCDGPWIWDGVTSIAELCCHDGHY